jgi:hypothetical protein
MLNLTYRPTAFFNARLELSLNNYAYHVLFRPDQWNDRSQWNASVRLNVWTKLWNKLQLFGNIRYNTRQLTFMYFSDPTFVADLGVSADLLDRRLSLYLNAKDLFGSYVSTSTGLNPYLASASTQRNSSRYVSLGLTLRLGKMELEDKARTGEHLYYAREGGSETSRGKFARSRSLYAKAAELAVIFRENYPCLEAIPKGEWYLEKPLLGSYEEMKKAYIAEKSGE